MKYPVPGTLMAEHEELRRELAMARKSGGKTGAAADQVAQFLLPHLVKEEEYALPPLGLLPALAGGRVIPEMREVIAMTDRLKRELGRMRDEHRDIIAWLRMLAGSAKEEGRMECIRFARRFTLHAQAEEEIFYPAAILIGEYLKLKLGAGP